MSNYEPLIDGESPAHEAINTRLQALDSALPGSVNPGFISLWLTNSPPSGWLLCDGAAVSRATYAALFAAIGTSYGAGDGSTTFNLPDSRGRAVAGAGTGAGLSTRTLGQQVGAETHQLSVAELAAHAHSSGRSGTLGVGSGAAGGVSTNSSGTDPTGSSGSDTPHNNMQPSLVLNWIIKT